jgi:hypothetical protein
LHSQLVRRGLPADYAEHAAAELADHHRDLIDELTATGLSESQASTEASHRLGDSRTLVKNTVRAYQRRHFCGRWPLVAFILGPLLMLLVIWVATGLILYGIGSFSERFGSSSTQEFESVPFWHWVMIVLAVAWFLFAAPAMVVFKLARMSNRAAVSWKLVAVSACLIGVAVGYIDLRLPVRQMRTIFVDGKLMQSDRPQFMVGVPMGIPSWQNAWNYYTKDTLRLCRTLLPLAIVVAVSIHAKRESQLAERRLAGC